MRFCCIGRRYSIEDIRNIFLDNLDIPIDDFVEMLREKCIFIQCDDLDLEEFVRIYRLYLTDRMLLERYLWFLYEGDDECVEHVTRLLGKARIRYGCL